MISGIGAEAESDFVNRLESLKYKVLLIDIGKHGRSAQHAKLKISEVTLPD